jgi:hypothetical protein
MTKNVRHVVPICLALVGVAVVFTACGGTSTPGVASSGSTTTTTAPPSASQSAQFVKFGSCMRSHGEPQFQNPIASGNSVTFAVTPGLGIGTPRYARAATACIRYLPLSYVRGTPPGDLVPGMQQITQADEADYLRAVACMHSHGFPSIPDPAFTGGGVRITVPSSIDKNSPVFQRALSTCRKLIPSGLPYSH